MPHAARVGEDHSFEQRAALLDLGQFVDLLLVFGHRETHLGMVEHKGHLVGDRILVDRDRNAAQSLRRGDRPIEPRPVVADDRELVAAPETQFRQTAGERLDLSRDLRPAPALPNAVILFAVRRPIRPHARMFEQELWERVQCARPRGSGAVTQQRGGAPSHRCSLALCNPTLFLMRPRPVSNRISAPGQAPPGPVLGHDSGDTLGISDRFKIVNVRRGSS